MKIGLLFIGKDEFGYVKEGIEIYQKRIKAYLPFEITVIQIPKREKNDEIELIKKKEGEKILSNLKGKQKLILLDERGKEFSSLQFAKYIESEMNFSTKDLLFVIGGAYGFSDEVYDKAEMKISLSPLTFSHQLVRVVFTEQLYRALSIIKGEPYHHE